MELLWEAAVIQLLLLLLMLKMTMQRDYRQKNDVDATTAPECAVHRDC